ncbi:MAG: bacillithiol transferase BstA [Gemmataceae bacterium]
MEPPQYPAGPHNPGEQPTPAVRGRWIAEVEAAPAALRAAVTGLTDGQLDTRYKNWTVRQIVHHLADSHVNAYVRFKLALTEDTPAIKPYDEGRWVALDDERRGDIAVPLALLDALHAAWGRLLRSMTDGQFARSYFHPETNGTVPLAVALGSYAWHGRHHTAQVDWLRQRHGWGR